MFCLRKNKAMLGTIDKVKAKGKTLFVSNVEYNMQDSVTGNCNNPKENNV